MKHGRMALLALLVLSAAGALRPALAEGGWARHEPGHFDHDEYRHWRGGHWVHGPHYGRGGWWWVADGMWYAFPQPVYPFPDPYAVPVVPLAPPPPPAPAGILPPGAPATPATDGYWYYCSPTQRYFPFVHHCPAPWLRIAPAPGR